MAFSLAPAHLPAIAMALFGIGLIVAAFAGEGFDLLRLFLGLGLVVAALLTAGLQVLLGNAAPTRPSEEA